MFANHWLVGQWDSEFIQQAKPSIEFLELFALTAALTTWKNHPDLNNARIAIFCDNEAVLHMVNNLSSSCMQCLKLIRILAFQGILYNRRVRVKFVRFKENTLADTLSRLDFIRFW